MAEEARLRLNGPAAVAEGLFLAALALAAWPYGCAPEGARYALAGALLAAGALWAAGLFRQGRGLPPLALPAAALPAAGLVQLALGRSAAPVWTAEALLVLAAMLSATLFWSERTRDRAAARRLAFAILLACAAQAVFAAVQWSADPQRIYGHAVATVTTPFGSFVNHNHFAGFVEMGAVLAAGMALGAARRKEGLSAAGVGLGGLALGLVAAHVASRSRGGLIALVGGLLALGLLDRHARRRTSGGWRDLAPAAAALAALLGFGIAVVPSPTRAHLATLLRGTAEPAASYRVDVAVGTLRMAAARPILGWGLGAYADAFTRFKPDHGDVRTTHAESDGLELPAEAGLLGLLAAAWLGAAVFRALGERLHEGHDPGRRGLALGAAGGAAALLVHGLVDFNLRIPSNALLFASLLGLAGAPRAEPTPSGGRRASAALALVLGAMAIAAGWRAAGELSLQRALAPADLQLRIAALDRTLAAHPYLARAYRARGLAWRDLGWVDTGLGAGRLALAEADLLRSLRLRPSWAEAWAELSWVRFRRGEAAPAREAMEMAVALDPTHPGIRASSRELASRMGAETR